MTIAADDIFIFFNLFVREDEPRYFIRLAASRWLKLDDKHSLPEVPKEEEPMTKQMQHMKPLTPNKEETN